MSKYEIGDIVELTNGRIDTILTIRTLRDGRINYLLTGDAHSGESGKELWWMQDYTNVVISDASIKCKLIRQE